MGSAYRARIHLKERSNPTSSVDPLQEAGERRESDSMTRGGGTLVFEPLPSAVHQFMRDLVAAHSDDSSFDIVVDNAKSGETAKKWNEIRRYSSRRNSLPIPTRWSSDSGVSLASSPEDTRRSLYRDGCSTAPSNMGLVGRRNSLDPSHMNRSPSSSPAASTTTKPRLQLRPRPGAVGTTPDLKPNYPSHHQPQRRREPMESTHYSSSSSIGNEHLQPPSSPYTSEGSDSDFSDYFTSDAEELEKNLRRKSKKPVPKNNENPVPPSESALSLALISTIERLSVRAALAICRPQTSSVVQAATMQTIDEAMELLPTRGSVTDVSTASCRSRRSSSTSAAHMVVASHLSSGEKGETETTTYTITKEDEDEDSSNPASPQQLQHPQILACKQQSDLNSAMLAAIDRLSVRAALTLTNLSSEFSHDDKSCDEA